MTRRRKAVSPVIATVILIAVAVALGIAVAFWASGLTSSFSKYEKLGVNTQYATGEVSSACGGLATGGSCWQVNLGGQNTGSSDATITQIQVNGVPFNPSAGATYNVTYTVNGGSKQTITGSSIAISVPSGNAFTITFALPSGATSAPVTSKTFNHGQTIQVVLVTAAGNNYPASIVLP